MPGVSPQAAAPAGRAVVALALAVVIVSGLALPLHDLLAYPDRLSVLSSLQIDASTYDQLGSDIATTGTWRDFPALQPPDFVAVLALIYRVFGHSNVIAKIFLWLCLVACTCLGGWLTQRVWGREPALVAMVLMATAPALRHYVGTLQYEVVVAAGLMAALGLTVKALEAPWPRSLAWACAAGVFGGALTLVREVLIGVIPLLGVWMMTRLWPRVTARRSLGLGFAFLALFAAPVASWSVLQSSRYGRTILVSDKGVAALALGNNPGASGTFSAGSIEQPAGLAFIRERPTAALRLAVRRCCISGDCAAIDGTCHGPPASGCFGRLEVYCLWTSPSRWPEVAGCWSRRSSRRHGCGGAAPWRGGGCCRRSWRRAARHTSRRSRRTGSLCRSCL